MIERWLPCGGDYEVSNMGRVRSLKGLLNPRPDTKGYLFVTLFIDHQKYIRRVHRLVAVAFLGPSDMPVVRHLNGNKRDNRLINLAHGDFSDNAFDSVAHGTHALAQRTSCLRGHDFTEENTRMYRGARICRACDRIRQALAKQRRAAS